MGCFRCHPHSGHACQHDSPRGAGMSAWKRYRFYSSAEDFRPVTFPPPGPYWCSGHESAGEDSERAILIAYLPTNAKLTDYWPEAEDEESTDEDSITFTSRFPCPEWWALGS